MFRYRLIHLAMLLLLFAAYFAWLRMTLTFGFILGPPLVCIYFGGLVALFEWHFGAPGGVGVAGGVMIAIAVGFPLLA